MTSIVLYTDVPEKRLEYISDFLFRTVLGINCQCTSDQAYFRQITGPKIYYSRQHIEGEGFYIPAHPFLTHRPIKDWSIEVRMLEGLPAFFCLQQPSADLDFDWFSMAFFLLSRYEEYLPFQADQHGRFPATASLAHQHQFLQLPLIDLWAYKIKEKLLDRYPQLRFAPPSYHYRPTIDIDMAWSFLHKGWLRSLGAVLRAGSQGNISALRQRFKVLRGRQPDPFYTFPYMEKLHRKFQVQPVYFWLLGEYGEYDKNSAPSHPRFQQLIREQSQKSIVTALHPSYRSNQEPERIAGEKKVLEHIIGKSITQSRQHFLMLRFPETYRQLQEAGITEDFTMGYADALGFRASTAHPFQWYDLEQDQVSQLQVHPFQLMDVSLQKYLGYQPEEALEAIRPLIAVCRQVGGPLVSIWHNSSLTDEGNWKGWKKVYEKLLEYAVESP